MHAITVSLVGTAVSAVRHTTTASGLPVARFRMVSQPRRYDATAGTFIDLDSSYVTVLAWRSLANHLNTSLRKGDPVLVVGRLRVREWEHEGRTGVAVEVDATAVGHDLSRGVSRFSRSTRPLEAVGSDEPAGNVAALPDAAPTDGDRTGVDPRTVEPPAAA
jgi:single-strand DNA-binding protein